MPCTYPGWLEYNNCSLPTPPADKFCLFHGFTKNYFLWIFWFRNNPTDQIHFPCWLFNPWSIFQVIWNFIVFIGISPPSAFSKFSWQHKFLDKSDANIGPFQPADINKPINSVTIIKEPFLNLYLTSQTFTEGPVSAIRIRNINHMPRKGIFMAYQF